MNTTGEAPHNLAPRDLAPRNLARRLAPVTLVLVFAGAMLGITWQSQGMLAMQRVLIDLMMPVGLAWLASFWVAITQAMRGNRRHALLAGLVFVAITTLFSPLVNRELMRLTEAPPLALSPLDQDAPVYRAVIVLGGGASLGSDGEPQFTTDGHRVAMAAQMWHAGKTQTIICTGDDDFVPGAVPENPKDLDERDRWNPARIGVELLASLGVPQEKLFRVGGINTYFEMQNLSAFLTTPPNGFPSEGKIGLITSAFHIPRALRLAEAHGLKFDPIPVCFRTGPREPLAVSDFIPHVNAGAQFYTLAREHLARLVGR
jgi:uncharacterized SAM-binding protein YcdF (DUF218 family)